MYLHFNLVKLVWPIIISWWLRNLHTTAKTVKNLPPAWAQNKWKKKKKNNFKVEKKVSCEQEEGPPPQHTMWFPTRGRAGLFCCCHHNLLLCCQGDTARMWYSIARAPHFFSTSASSLFRQLWLEGRRPWVVAGGQSGGATGETEMKLLRVLVTLWCICFDAAKSDGSCNCDGKLCHAALTGRDPCAFSAGSYCFLFGKRKRWYLCIWGTTSNLILAKTLNIFHRILPSLFWDYIKAFDWKTLMLEKNTEATH